MDFWIFFCAGFRRQLHANTASRRRILLSPILPVFAAKPPPHLAAGGSPQNRSHHTAKRSREAATATCTGNATGQLPIGYETRGTFALPLALYNRLRGNRCLNLTGLQTVTNFDNHGRFPSPILPMSASVSPLRALAGSPSFPQLEQEILQFWDDNDIYHESLRRRADCPSFVFYEGPPTANGMPHPGHCLTRSIKDVFPRYKTMRGLSLRAESGLGYARVAGRSRSRQRDGDPQQRGNRSLR